MSHGLYAINWANLTCKKLSLSFLSSVIEALMRFTLDNELLDVS